MRRFLAGLALAGLLIGCGQTTSQTASPPSGGAEGYAVADQASRRVERAEEAPVNAAAPAPPPTDADGRSQPPQPQPPSQPGGGTNSPVLYLAYSYGMSLEIPSQRLAGVMDRHVQACVVAGPRLCQLVGATRSGDPESFIEGAVSLRGEPVWLRTFMGGIAAEVDEAGGRIQSQTTTTEDLTRQIVDTEAYVRAQLSLRERLETLLRTSRGRLADLLEVERELARVQAQINSSQSNLAVMRTRVAMSELSIQYRSAPRSVGSDTFEPLRNAFASFLGIIVGGVAVIVTIIAGLIPIALVVVPIVWAIFAWRRRRGGKLLRGSAPDAPSEPGNGPAGGA